MRITIIGAGYVGLVTGVSLAENGHEVAFVEQRSDRRDALAEGRLPIEEPGLPEAFANARARIRVAGELADVGTGDLTLVAVGTPIGDGGRSDLRGLLDVLEVLAAHPDAHVCVRSTLPPGFSVRLPSLLGRDDGRGVSTNPEFLRQGDALADVRQPTRIVYGLFPETTRDHVARLDAMYEDVDAPRLSVSVTAAELMKNASNAFLALKLSFVNEIASLAEEYDVDVGEVLAGIGHDPRIGGLYMRPGLGFGGSCLPKELEVVAAAGRRRGLTMHVARAAALVNVEQQSRFARRILDELGTGEHHRVALLGMSFKARTDDLRGSPSLAVARELLDAGVSVIAHDPAVRPEAALAEVPGLEIAPDPMEAVEAADAIVIGTEWSVYGELDWGAIRARVARPIVFDGRNLLDPVTIARHGFAYRGVGRPSVEPEQA